MRTPISLSLSRRNLNVFVACLLSFSLVAMPFVPITVASSAAESQSVRKSKPDSPAPGATYNASLNGPVPMPAPMPFLPTITATKVDAIIGDDGDGKADPNPSPAAAEKIEYTVTISNTGTTDATGVAFTDTVDANTTLVPDSVNTQPIADPDTYSASGNIQISLAAGAGVLANDRDPDTGNSTGLTVSKVQGVGANVGVATETTATGRGSVKGSVTLSSDGSFTYEPPPGFEGADTFTYEITDGTKTDTATVTINISGMAWFISNNAGGLNRGTFSNPFTTIATFNAANVSGVAPDPKNNDVISLRTGTGTYSETDGINLRQGQKLIGNAVQFNTVFAAAANSSSAYTTFAGAVGTAPTIVTSAGNGVDLSIDNTVRGLNVGNTPGFFKINGGAVGTPVINTVNLGGTGGALNVATSGTFAAVSFGTFESTSSPAANVNLVNVTGALGITSPGAGLSGSAAASAAVNVSGGSVGFTYAGNVSKANAGSLVSISGGHTGTITFQTGTLSATLGDGLQFNNADGTYNFNGTNTLGGGDAGIDILNGSGGTFSFSASSTIASPTGTAFNVGTGAPNVTYSGSITHNTAGQRAVNIDGTTGGSISIATVTAGSTAGGVGNTGVNINNAGGSVTFTNLNLGTNSTRMTAQAVTIAGGSGAKDLGIVSVFTTGAAQGIVSTTSTGSITIDDGTVDTAGAAALNLSGTNNTTRTPLNIQLDTVNTTGGSAGIVLVNTSATGVPGGFRILGTGGTCTNAVTTGCSGGQIANTTGADTNTGSAGTGVHMTNVDTVILTRMHIHDHSNYGIKGINVNGFRLDTSVIKGVNGNNPAAPFFDGGVVFDGTGASPAQGLVGSAAIINSDIRGGRSSNFHVDNDASVLNLTVSGSTFRDTTDAANANDNIFIELGNTAQGFVSITGSTFGETSGDHIQANLINTAIGHFTITGNTMTGIGSAKINTRFGMGILIAGGTWTGTCRYNISNNTISGTRQGHAIHTNKGGPTGGTMEGTISGNTIGVAANAESGASESSGITVASRGSSGVHTALVSGNTIHQTDEFGINLEVGEDAGASLASTAATLNVTLLNNTIDTPGPNALHGIHLNSGLTVTDNNTACADIGHATTVGLKNNVTAAANEGNGGSDIRIRQRQGTRVELPGYTGGVFVPGNVNSYLTGRNNLTTISTTFNNDAGTANDGFFNTAGGVPCAQPTAPTLPAAPISSVISPASRPDVVAANTAKPTDSATQPAQPSLLARAKNGLANFASGVLSLIEPTAHASSDMTAAASSAETFKSSSQPAQARTEQQTAVRTKDARSGKTLSHHAKLRSPGAFVAPMSGEAINITIGTLRPGDSVTITFQVTVDNPPNLSLLDPPRVRNQGKVTSTNHADVFTDDPAAGGPADPTDTPVDLFDTTTTLASDLNPSNFGDLVTFTATVAENPAQASVDPTGSVDFIDTSDSNAVICNDVALTAGSAQCQTSTLTAGTHQIRAVYSGDGNFETSQSELLAQVVIACAADPIVTTNADDGDGSLRQAISQVCNGDTITFNIDGDGPHTIALTTGELVVAKDVTIRNTSGESITVSGGGTSRVFNINPTKTVAIIGLTISGGDSATSGGGILNDGTLTIANSTLTLNSTDIDGGAISNSGPASLTLINTTISGNNAAVNGGGVVNLGGTVTSINSTITNNHVDIGTGGGIHHGSGTTTLHNTIVAGNFNENEPSADTADDISGTVNAASSFNLIGTGGSGGLTGANSNLVNVADAGLGALANNGGTTQTHALLATSVAVEAGGNGNLPADTLDLDGDADMAEALPVDQRGTGFPRNADSSDANTTQTVDIGAFELHPSIEDIANQTTNEDTPKNVMFNLGDDTGALIATVTATSSNTTLVPNANLLVSGSGGSRTLQITPAANESGTTTITVTVTAANGRTATDTFDLTVNAVNDAPVANDDSYSTNEDTPLSVLAADGVLANDTDNDTAMLTAALVSGPSNAASFTLNSNGSFDYTPNPNFNGPDTFTYKANDGTSDSNVATVTITVNAINDPPTVAVNLGLAVNEGSTNNIITNTRLRVDDVDNTAAQIVFTIGTAPVNGTLKNNGSALASGGTFTQDDINNNRVTYDHDGSQTTSDSFTFTVSDGAGGTISSTTFNITIGEVNDAPTITAGGTLNYTENDLATAIDTTIAVADVDSANLASATVQITGNYANGQDVLSFTNTATITAGAFNAVTGTLTLSGSDSVANYQAALHAVKYNNTSDNPSTAVRTVSWIVNDGELPSNTATSTINVTAVNDAPVNNVPGPQSTNQNTPLTFTGGNVISVSDVDAGGSVIQVALTAANGTLTLDGIVGLNFACGGCSGTGTADASMTFQGTITDINNALDGMMFTPTAGFSGAASVTITTNDLGNTGTGGAKSTTNVVNIQVATNISIQDAQVVEPASGSVNMIFTVTLSAPAPGTGASVNFTTVELASALNHATAGQDYTTTTGTVNFAPGEQFKTIAVPVLSDNKKNEANEETFEVHLSGEMNATLADGIAIGTILSQNQAGTLLISEIRTSGPGGGGNDFVEIYNNSDSEHPVPAGGYGLFKMGETCSDTPVLVGTIPGGTTIPARGHFLFTGPSYSLANYGGDGAAVGDAVVADIENDRNVALFSTTSVGIISSANRFDAVGFGPNVGGVCDLFREGNTLTPLAGSTLEYSYFRDECGKKGNPSLFGPCPTGGLTKDSNINSDDFIFADTQATNTPAGQRLGAPGPQNLGSPRFNLSILALLLDSTKGAAASPNRVRDTSAIGDNAAQGTLSIRRRFVNNTGAEVTKLRFRVVDISTTFVSGGVADLRLLSSSDIMVSVSDPATCSAATLSSPCTVTVRGTMLEEPPTQPLGGGYNSSTVTLPTPLLPGASINVQFVLGVQSTGSFKFFFNVEALP